MRTIILIPSMHCKSCEQLLTQALGELPGVAAVEVNLARKAAVVEHDGTVSVVQLREAISAEGYQTA